MFNKEDALQTLVLLSQIESYCFCAKTALPEPLSKNLEIIVGKLENIVLGKNTEKE